MDNDATVAHEGRYWQNQITPGALFVRLGHLVEVIRVQGEEVIVFNEETCAEYNITMLEAVELLQEYIG